MTPENKRHLVWLNLATVVSVAVAGVTDQNWPLYFTGGLIVLTLMTIIIKDK